jgi:putative transposase
VHCLQIGFCYDERVGYDRQIHRGRLSRLDAGYYRGRAFVHWSMTIEHRATGWLSELHHAKIRELLCHALSRHHIICPAYCLMPEHGHFLWMGTSDGSDQKLAAALFREGWNAELRRSNNELQKQPFDHVLDEAERGRGAFTAVAHYILQNPVRAGLMGKWQDYRFLGALVPGYPSLNPRDEDFWERFWRIYDKLSAPSTTGESLTASATNQNL